MTSVPLALWALVAPAVRSVALASPSPEPADVVRTPPAELVTPGTIGFLVTFGVAVALVFLVRDMVRRNRGLVVRAERRDAELRDAELRDAELRDAELRADGTAAAAGPDAAGHDHPDTRPAQPTTSREHDDRDGQRPAAPNG